MRPNENITFREWSWDERLSFAKDNPGFFPPGSTFFQPDKSVTGIYKYGELQTIQCQVIGLA